MHNLFHTSNPPFLYMNGDTMNCLTELNQYWLKNNDGPVITMDAGSNIHLLFREDQKNMYSEFTKVFLLKHNIWTDKGLVLKLAEAHE